MLLRGAISVAVTYLVLRLLFVPVLLVPVVAAQCALLALVPFAPIRVVLDPDRQEVAITHAWWTRRIPLTEVRDVDEIPRFGAEIKAGRMSYRFTPFRRRRWPERHLRLRSGFEGMETAITEAAALARAGREPAAVRSDDSGYPSALLSTAAGLAFIAAAMLLVQPQDHSTFVHVAAMALRVWWVLGGVIGVLIGLGLLVSRIRAGPPRPDRRVSAAPGPG